MTGGLVLLIERVRTDGDADAARELADLVETAIAVPDRRVGTAFGLRRRGGEPGWRKECRAQRDDAIRALARLLFADLPIGQMVRELRQKVSRYMVNGWPNEQRLAPSDNLERALLWRIAKSDLEIPGARQLRKILQRG